MTNARMKRRVTGNHNFCANRQHGVDRDPKRMTEMQKSHMPRACKRGEGSGRTGNSGAAPKFEQYGGNMTLIQAGRRGFIVDKPKRRKNPATTITT